MQLHNLFPFPEERKTRRRVGRGSGSGLGCTAGKGNKGQNARLCARLTGYNIDIRPESGYYGEDEEPKAAEPKTEDAE